MEYWERNIQAKVRLTEEDYKDISILYPKLVKKNIRKKSGLYIIAFVILFFIIGAVLQNLAAPVSTTAEPVIQRERSLADTVFRILLPTSFILLYIVLRILNPVLIKKSAKEEFGSNKLAQREINYSLTPDAIEITSVDFCLKLRYEDVYQAWVTNKYIVLFESERVVRIIPKKSFEDEEAVTAALQLLKENLPNGKYVNY